MKTGGYTIVQIPSGFSMSSSRSTSVEVSGEEVDKMKQWNKPVMIDHVEFTLDGGNVSMQGFTFHTMSAGVHTHHCGAFSIAVVGDKQISITVL